VNDNDDLLSEKLAALAESLMALKGLGRQLTADQQKLVELAHAQPRLRPTMAPAESDAAAPATAPPPREISDAAAAERQSELDRIRDLLGDCTRCKLHEGRQNIVFGAGNPGAELMFVGEGPGAEEDRQGIPFVGRAGDLLTKMIEAMGKKRGDVYIGNIVKCRPPGNRDPEADEVQACIPFLHAQIEAIQPRAIVCLGRVAMQNLLNTKVAVSKLRGQWQDFQGIPVMPTYHPAYLLRSPQAKRPTWEDLQKVIAHLNWTVPQRTKGK